MFEKFARPILDEFEDFLREGHYLAWARKNKIELRFGAEHHPITREWGRGFWLTTESSDGKNKSKSIFIWRPNIDDVGFFGRRLWVKEDGRIHILPYKIWEQGLTDVVRQYLLLQ